MSSRIDYLASSPAPADTVYATMVDPEYLRERLSRIGGRGAGLLEHAADEQGARYRVRHGLAAEDLPALVRNLVPGELVIERSERWTRKGDGQYLGEVDVTIPGTPASATGGMRIRDVDGGSEFAVRAEVTVNIPLLGGRIEAAVGEQIRSLLGAESQFTQEWLAKTS